VRHPVPALLWMWSRAHFRNPAANRIAKRGARNLASELSFVDRSGPGGSGDQTERMARRVRVHVVATGQAPCTKPQHRFLRAVEIVNHHIEVKLLRAGRVRPIRRLMIRGELKSQSRSLGVFRGYDPVLRLIGDGKSQEFRIERCQGYWVGTIDDYVVFATNHALSLVQNDLSRAGSCQSVRTRGQGI
jgi:hypothetical protein